jgi:hypothetical protein
LLVRRPHLENNPGLVPRSAHSRSVHSSSAKPAVVPAAPENGGPRNWEVTRTLHLREHPGTAARILATLRRGTILDNLGCQRIQGRAWCDVQPLGGGPRR